MQVTASIFKAYDIRGVVPSTLNESLAEGLGKAFGTQAMVEGQTQVAVGRDGDLGGDGAGRVRAARQRREGARGLVDAIATHVGALAVGGVGKAPVRADLNGRGL